MGKYIDLAKMSSIYELCEKHNESTDLQVWRLGELRSGSSNKTFLKELWDLGYGNYESDDILEQKEFIYKETEDFIIDM